MMPLVALCADEASMAHPELIGLADEQLFAQPWLRLFTSGSEIRTFLRHDRAVDEVWVVSCDDVEPINLAATIKGDRGDVRVCLVSFQGTGSLRSRASAANIDATLTRQAFVTRYAAFKRVRSAATLPIDRGGVADLQDSGPLFQPEEPVLPAPPPSAVQGAQPQLADIPSIAPLHPAVGVDPSQPARNHASAQPVPPIGAALDDAAAGRLPHPPVGCSADGLPQPPAPASPHAASAAAGAPVPPPGFSSSPDAALVSGSPYQPQFSAPPAPSAVAAPSPIGDPAAFAVRQGSQADALLLPIVSGSGGAGKSAVAVLVALLAQRRGLKTLLLDFDLQFGDMREMTGQSEALGIDEVLAEPARLAQLAPAAGMPALLGAPRHLEEAETVARSAPALLAALGGMFDVIVANTGSAWAEQHAVLLERCSKALFLIDQRASSIAACRRALDLCARCGIAVSPFLFAVNFCAKGAPLTSIDASCALRGAQTVELADGGAEVEEALSEGRPQDLIEAGNPLVASLDALLADILPSTGEAAGEPGVPAPRRSRRKRRRKRKGPS